MLKKISYFLLAVFACTACLLADEVNLALHKAYSLSPNPTYSYCTDADDRVQLTDGKTTEGYFWTQKGTVGWVHVPYSVITVDLGKSESIGRVEFTTAAGTAGVEFPMAVYVQVSEDGKLFREAAELISDELELNGPFPQKYALRCLHSKPLQTKGRYVRFLTMAAGTFIFCDEIRIFAGPELPEDFQVTSPAAEAPAQAYKTQRTRICLDRRYQNDLSEVRALIETSQLKPEEKEKLTERVRKSCEDRWEALKTLPKDFKAILPLESNHAAMHQTLAALWKAAGCADLTFGKAQIWDPLSRFVVPKDVPEAEIALTAMQAETRCAAFNVFNATQETQNLTLKLEGMEAAADVTVRRVLWTDTHICQPVACALPEVIPEKDGTYTIPVLSGLVQQVWFEFQTKKNKEIKTPRTFRGNVQCSWNSEGGQRSIPVEITVSPLVFPEKTTLELGGWDYTDGNPAYNLNSGNLPSFLKYVQSRHVNAPWARSGVLLANCKRDPASGQVTIDPTEFDAWIENWKPENVREYFIFMALGGWSSGTNVTFLGTQAGTKEFDEAVRSWLEAWVKHWAEKGISPDRINLLLHDEPNETTKDLAPLFTWVQAIHAACPEVKIWEDPCYRNLEKAPKEFFEACDVLCPNRPAWLEEEAEFDAFYGRQREEGRTLNLYSCSGPQRLLDPYAYCLLQAWEAARVGAKASFFWALGDGGGVTSWNEYFLGRNSYCPLFIDPASPDVVPGKHMEAIAESAQDYEYVSLLRAKIETLRSASPARAMELEAELNAQTLAALNSGRDLESESNSRANLNWDVLRDRAGSERARMRILELLEK